MKLSVDEDGTIEVTEVFNGIKLKTSDGETLGICMRDSGFELNYQGQWYEAKNGVVKKMGEE